jgi:DNA-binding MarR family transcriptional regulator
MGWCPDGNELDQAIFDALAEFVSRLLRRGEALAQQFGVPVFCVKAIHRLGEPVTMKELGRSLHCDPSFITMIADELERRGLARREPNPVDRRIKNLVLTPEGLALKARLERALLAEMPWSHALSPDERKILLGLVRKMNDAIAGPSARQAAGEPAEEVNATLTAASRPDR